MALAWRAVSTNDEHVALGTETLSVECTDESTDASHVGVASIVLETGGDDTHHAWKQLATMECDDEGDTITPMTTINEDAAADFRRRLVAIAAISLSESFNVNVIWSMSPFMLEEIQLPSIYFSPLTHFTPRTSGCRKRKLGAGSVCFLQRSS